MKTSVDPEQRSSAGNPSTKSLKGSTESAPDLANKRSTAGQETAKGRAHRKSSASTSTAKHSSSLSQKQVAGGRQSTEKKDGAAPEKDTKEAGFDVVEEEPAVDPREPLPNRAVIDRRVSMGEVLPTEPPAQFLSQAHDGDILAAIMEACHGMEVGAVEPQTDPREPLSRRASIDRRVSLGHVILTMPAESSPVRSASVTGDYGESSLDAPKGAPPEAATDSAHEPRPDPREPLPRRASIDKSISLGKVVSMAPPPRSPISSRTSSGKPSPGWSEEERRRNRQAMTRLAALSGLAVFFMALAILSLIVVRSAYFRASQRFEVCDTDECVQHSKDILATLNKSANPCGSLYAYVCGYDARPEGTPYAGPLVHAYVREVMTTLGDAETFLAAKQRYAAATKAFAAVVNCIESNRHTAADDFAAFMHDRGVPWPLRDASSRNTTLFGVFDVVLDLVVNWRVALWFDVVVSQTASHDANPAVIIREPGDLVALRSEQLTLFDDVTYNTALRKMSLYLTGGKVSLDDAAVKQLRQDEAAFSQIVLASVEDDDGGDGFDVLLSLGNITQVFGAVLSVTEWSSLLNKHLSTAIRNVSNNTSMLFLNKGRLGRLGRLVESLPATRVMDVIGWTFSYAYAWMVNAHFDFPAQATTAGRLEINALCFVAEQESFGIVQAAPIFRDAFDVNEREKVTAALQKTSEALIKQVLASPAISNYSKREAVAKLDALVWNYWLWPLDPYLQVHSALNTLYANFSDKPGSVFESWIRSRKSLRAALATPHYERLMTSRYRWQSGGVRYIYSLNELRFTLSALFPPSYVRRGSSAMTFAGLGFKVARQMARSLDMHGRTLDSTGSTIPWWQPANSKQQQCRFDVAESDMERSLLIDQFAIEVALEAMQASSALRPSKSPKRLKFLEWLSDEQTFYVSYCSHYCSEPRGQPACNLAMNSSQFDDVFGCSRSRSNSPACVFL
ncbi:uncharacterized protein LOC119385770 [Rhipicephalus sanguineus]|uniref:Uncharacterized protein n=1 Tax=Rhipicephalus sanguineus TaxID=34632 RepID=A0A9D4PYR0_RHISA|nr:uncharacterized protein LOC119385770 [Rhipicephalus sanguineus]KAH7961295.1 hypothetical protein HPB52_006688 [Rhipicephalus sanguineus]